MRVSNHRRRLIPLLVVSFVVVVVGFAVFVVSSGPLAAKDLVVQAQTAHPLVERIVSPTTASRVEREAAVFYDQQVRPILDQRCVVCHACYDAPCQLNLSSPEGIDRGANKQLVYEGTRLRPADPTRLGLDAQTTLQWRNKGFYSVLDVDLPARESAPLLRLLRLKQKHPLPQGDLLAPEFTLGLDRQQSCPAPSEVDRFEQEHPSWGMPYGLPGLAASEFAVLTRWLEDGAMMSVPAPLSVALAQQVTRWERFLNGDSLKQQLASRYIYEHLFLAHLYFDEVRGPAASRSFFKLVRSRTPPGQPLSIIATRQPFDDPGVERVYYRFQRDDTSIVSKTHMPYVLNGAQMEWMKSLFLVPNYTVVKLPAYDAESISNPFLSFRDLPVESRYRFMLEQAQFTVMGFIKGPVCRGQVALNVIDDHFWVVFVSPKEENSHTLERFLLEQGKNMGIPNAEERGIGGTAKAWVAYSLKQREYLAARSKMLNNFFSTNHKISMDMIWDGDGHNPNAALTIFRHFDSSTVEQGLLGQAPKTAWVISYPLLERIHYLLVAGFDVYGNLGHQLNTRLYMDFLRMEGEVNFLAFLPREDRDALRKFWYRDTRFEVNDFVFKPALHFDRDTGIVFQSSQPKLEFYEMLKDWLAPVLNHRHDLDLRKLPYNQGYALARINHVAGKRASLFPELSMLLVEGEGHEDQVFTLIRNSGHSNITSLLNENGQRLPEEDYLTLLKGVVGSYPGAFLRVKEGELNRFVNALEQVDSEAAYAAFLGRYGVRRTASDFWVVSDRFHALYFLENPVEAGLLDFNRLENR
ncbi:Fatty acid cis/trans isomerase [gamma proteobacterium HdN1]|nr:Fatty acid cis/trans isomerase [gamma proteobacterium HdN1]